MRQKVLLTPPCASNLADRAVCARLEEVGVEGVPAPFVVPRSIDRALRPVCGSTRSLQVRPEAFSGSEGCEEGGDAVVLGHRDELDECLGPAGSSRMVT
jgi:hypothetical protein